METTETSGPDAADADGTKPHGPVPVSVSGPAQVLAAQPAEDGSRRMKYLWLALSTLLLALTAAAAVWLCYVLIVIRPFGSYDKIMPNVYCAGVDLSGMTVEEAAAAIDGAMEHPTYSVRLILPDREYVFQPRQNGIEVLSEDAAQRAYRYGRNDESAFGMYRSYQAALLTRYDLEPDAEFQYSTRDILDQAVEVFKETYQDATETTASWDSEARTVTVVPGQPGRRIEPQEIYDAVCSAFQRMDFSDISLAYTPVEIDLTQAEAVCTDAAQKDRIPVTEPQVLADQDLRVIQVTLGLQGWEIDGGALYAAVLETVEAGDYAPCTLEMTPIEPAAPSLDDAAAALTQDPVEPHYSGGVIVEGTNGYSLDRSAALAQLQGAGYGDSLSIALTATPPKMNAEDIRAVLFRDQLSSYSTEHTYNENRTNNLRLACEAIDGTVINPGELFSFNNVVGERTSDKGYRTATVYVGSESKEELGGGICQVASTIYNAALYAEMEIVSRDCHAFFVTYVPGGLDATVYWGSVDFSFRNSSAYPIRINASVYDGSVHISLDGTKTNDHVVELDSARLSTEPYGTVYEYSDSLPAGSSTQTVSPYTGYTYEAYQYIYDGDGNLLDTVYLGTSTYNMRNQVITVGTG